MSKHQPLVSVIVPTYNSANFVEACLNSIQNQTYKHIELIVVDNNSTDTTKTIAKKYTSKVYNRGPERSAQRNYGAKKSSGDFLLFIDSDMELTPEVVKQCVDQSVKMNCQAVVIPEESFGEGFWAKCKALERSFYIGVDWMEAARFFKRESFYKVKGYDECLISGEDWDLAQRAASKEETKRVNSYILHNEGKLSLKRTLQKKLYYASKIHLYSNKQVHFASIQKQSNLLNRYKLFFSDKKKPYKTPIVFVGMLVMKTLEFGAGGLGLIGAKITSNTKDQLPSYTQGNINRK